MLSVSFYQLLYNSVACFQCGEDPCFDLMSDPDTRGKKCHLIISDIKPNL